MFHGCKEALCRLGHSGSGSRHYLFLSSDHDDTSIAQHVYGIEI
jgi:hypothetical protein